MTGTGGRRFSSWQKDCMQARPAWRKKMKIERVTVAKLALDRLNWRFILPVFSFVFSKVFLQRLGQTGEPWLFVRSYLKSYHVIHLLIDSNCVNIFLGYWRPILPSNLTCFRSFGEFLLADSQTFGSQALHYHCASLQLMDQQVVQYGERTLEETTNWRGISCFYLVLSCFILGSLCQIKTWRSTGTTGGFAFPTTRDGLRLWNSVHPKCRW